MITENSKKENHEIECQFGNAIRRLKISKLLKASNFYFLNSKKQDIAFSKNTYYRSLENTHYNWKRFLTLLAVKVTGYFNTPLKQLLKILCDGIKNRTIVITNEVKAQLINRLVSQPTFIKGLFPEFLWEV